MQVEMSEQEWFDLVKLVYHKKTPLELSQQLDSTVKRIEQKRLNNREFLCDRNMQKTPRPFLY